MLADHKKTYVLLPILFSFSLMFLLVQTAIAGGPDPQSIAINEVFYQGNANEDWAELINRGNEPVDISGWRWCSRFVYPTIVAGDILSGNADLTIEPGEIIALRLGMDANDSAADLGLYVSPPFNSANNMVDFVQWGTGVDVGRPDIAVTKNIWLEIETDVYDFVPTAAATETLSWCGTESDGGFLTTSLDFVNTNATQGSANNFATCDLIFADGFE